MDEYGSVRVMGAVYCILVNVLTENRARPRLAHSLLLALPSSWKFNEAFQILDRLGPALPHSTRTQVHVLCALALPRAKSSVGST